MIADFIAAVFLVTVIYVLVRPRSAAPDAVKIVGDALAALVRTAVNI